MATSCRVCHPEDYHTKNPDPQHIHVDDTNLPSDTSDSDDESDSNSCSSNSDSDHEIQDNSGKAKAINDIDEEEIEHPIHSQAINNRHNTGNTRDGTSDHKEFKREIHGKSKTKNKKVIKGTRGKRTNSKRSVGKKKSRVVMPTEKSYKIANITKPHWKCGDKTKLVYLGPNSKRGKREFDIVEAEMQKTINHNDNCESGGGCFDRYYITKIEKIAQGCAWRRYQARKTDVSLEAGFPNERMLFHGTDAVWDIVSGGFDERYSSTNGQFGAGLYFAQHSSLANQFVFGYFGGNGCKRHQDKNCYICDRHLLLCRVTLGKPYELKSIENLAHPPPGYHSVEALVGKGAFQNPEFVIYRGEQAYPEYLITYKIVNPKEDKQDGSESNSKDGDVVGATSHSRLHVRHQSLDDRREDGNGISNSWGYGVSRRHDAKSYRHN